MHPTIWNEQTKLLANWLDRASTALITAGVLTPLVAWLLNIGGLQIYVSLTWMTAFVAVCLLSAVGLHVLGRYTLEFMRP